MPSLRATILNLGVTQSATQAEISALLTQHDAGQFTALHSESLDDDGGGVVATSLLATFRTKKGNVPPGRKLAD